MVADLVKALSATDAELQGLTSETVNANVPASPQQIISRRQAAVARH